LKPSSERLVAHFDVVNRQKLFTGMGGTEFLIPVPTQCHSFVLYLIRDAIVGSLSSGAVANTDGTILSNVSNDSPCLPFCYV
jgi:hypothetical protein